MLISKPKLPASRLAFWVSIGGVVVGIVAGFLAGAQPLYLGLAIGAVVAVVYFFADFERAVLGLLILRSSLDVFSAQQIPAAFAIGVDALTLLYVTVQLLTHRTVHTDRFWWFFAGWVALQGLWLILLPLGGLGMDSSLLPDSLREWVRLFSWLIVYLLVMQLKDRVHPEKIILALFFGLVLPLTVALVQMIVPPKLLPSILVYGGDATASLPFEAGSRLNGTLGHPNSFATFLLLFVGLTYWKLNQANRHWFWFLLLGLIAFFLVSTKTLISLLMLATFMLVLLVPRMNLLNLVGGLILFALVIGLFASSEFGRERLSSIANTPLLNPDIDVSRAILLAQRDNNSFNWRIAQWTFLLKSWQQHPIFGYGLATSSYISIFNNYPHNDYIRALVEEGIVGLVAFIVFLGAQVTRLVQLLQSTNRGSAQHYLCLILLAVFLATLIGMCTDNVWSHTTLYFYWWTLFAVAGWNWNKLQSSSARSMPSASVSRLTTR
ncbi:O-antigen ligase family protein [Gloeocapsopsis dulcis]|uniref:Polymerase n=1 Tax=Gloeocapsopsis dulcis AAB1 = 1H9 TaxID=1433147 RepID=A0A6N8G0M2_9CHRO|nr:O-antigen ligase family protein [Gloeocapsopsis dulcis]MUL38751.1 polymerase [Gloeocapsopsis dulcis AAB1 = 1H9]WNN91665.1 O-antigen ligase family protein [Gloeocapsopsis dulcis]